MKLRDIGIAILLLGMATMIWNYTYVAGIEAYNTIKAFGIAIIILGAVIIAVHFLRKKS